MTALENMIRSMRQKQMLTSPELEEAFRTVDRCQFVPAALQRECYDDRPLSIGSGQTISQPSTVAFMLELLKAGPGHHVLDVGAGSCWTTALIAYLVGESGHVIALERVQKLAEFGRNNIQKGDWPQVKVYHANGLLGWPGSAPYDRILVSAAAKKVPDALVEQLKPGGRLVIPLSDYWGNMKLISKAEDGTLSEQTHPGFAFVPFVETDE